MEQVSFFSNPPFMCKRIEVPGKLEQFKPLVAYELYPWCTLGCGFKAGRCRVGVLLKCASVYRVLLDDGCRFMYSYGDVKFSEIHGMS